MTMGEKLTVEREKRGLSQSQVAQLCGVSKMAISQYEHDKRTPRDEIKKKLSTLYKVSVTNLFFAD